jgi:sarcosine oxidase
MELLMQTGGVMVGPESGPLFAGALASAQTHHIPHQLLDAPALSERFPAYRARPDWVALFEHRAGMLFPERCVEALMTGAKRRGAEVRLDEAVRRWSSNAKGLTLETMTGKYAVSRLVVAAGPWLPNLIDSLGVLLPLEIERQLSHWFHPTTNDDRFLPGRCPIGLWEPRNGDVFATFPDEGHGVKCGAHHAGAITSPDSVDRKVSNAENEAARRVLEQVMPGAGGRLRESRVCLYTNTPDRHFIIDWLDGGRVLVVSPCSGHGFKFASSIGEIVCQLLLDGRTWLDLSPFSLKRFR